MKITVWGTALCAECQRVYDLIVAANFGHAVEKKEASGLAAESPEIRSEVMSAVAMENMRYPVVQIGSVAYGPREALNILGIEE